MFCKSTFDKFVREVCFFFFFFFGYNSAFNLAVNLVWRSFGDLFHSKEIVLELFFIAVLYFDQIFPGWLGTFRNIPDLLVNRRFSNYKIHIQNSIALNCYQSYRQNPNINFCSPEVFCYRCKFYQNSKPLFCCLTACKSKNLVETRLSHHGVKKIRNKTRKNRTKQKF